LVLIAAEQQVASSQRPSVGRQACDPARFPVAQQGCPWSPQGTQRMK
jgi:hypothetical protein